MTTILINFNCLGDFDKDRKNAKTHSIVEALSEHFDIVAFSTWRKESERHELLQWLVDHCFAIEDLFLRPDDDYSKSVETVFSMIETNFANPERDVFMIFESDQRIVEALREDGFCVWETE